MLHFGHDNDTAFILAACSFLHSLMHRSQSLSVHASRLWAGCAEHQRQQQCIILSYLHQNDNKYEHDTG